MNGTGKRYFLVDAVRGAAIVNMVIFHFLYDVFIVYGKDPHWYGLRGIHIWQQAICQTFIFISGFVWVWGMEGNLRRGLRFHLFGCMISLVTLFAVPSQAIWFGILNFMGSAVLLMFPLHRTLGGASCFRGFILCLFLFVFCRQIQYGYIGFGDLVRIQVPDVLYSLKIFTPLGFPFPGFRSGDYFPVLPWIFLYLCGYFFNGIFGRHERWQRAAERRIPVLSVVGSRTIWIYLLHQPVCMAVCWLMMCG